MLLITQALSGQIRCDVSWDGSNSFGPPIGYNGSMIDCYPDVSGPFFIRIKAHIVRQSNTQGGQSTEAVRNAIARMQRNFTDYNIYFVWDACSISYVDSDYWYFKTNLSGGPGSDMNNLKNTYGSTDQIDIFFFPDEFLYSVNGASSNIPGTAVGIGGTYDYSPAGPAIEGPTLTHEIGHCLGLYHTFESIDANGTEELPNCPCGELPDESNCCNCGDLICDTRPYPDWIYTINPVTCEWTQQVTCTNDGVTYLYNDPETRNFMNYTSHSCANKFTDGQGARMRYVLNNSALLQATFATANTYYNLEIGAGTTDFVWDASDFPPSGVVTIYNSLKIKPGYALTINNGVTVKFSRNAGLIVEKNALLTLNGTLTGICNDYWQGITLYGQSNSTQYPNAGTGAYAQGRLIGLNRGWIENAVTAVQLQGPALNASGGQISCNGTTFKNNRTAIDAEYFSNNYPTPVSYLWLGNKPNKAYFYQCKFITDDDYLFLMDKFYAFFYLKWYKGVYINGCTFENTSTSPCTGNTNTCRGYGIFSDHSGFKVFPYYSTQTATKFSGLSQGVDAFSPQFRPISVNNADFEDCHIGMALTGINSTSLVGNKFYLGNMPGDPPFEAQYGMIIANASDFECSANKFYQVAGNAFRTVGICANNTGDADNVIDNNRFEGISIANLANKNNANAPNEIFSGLFYECNANYDVQEYDFSMPSAGDAIREKQGKAVGLANPKYNAAGNRFSYTLPNPPDGNQSDFQNNGTSFQYYYLPDDPIVPGDPQQEPRDYSGIGSKNPSTGNTCDGGLEQGSGLLSPTGLNSVRQAYFTYYGLYHTEKAAYEEALAHGNTSLAASKREISAIYKDIMQENAAKGLYHATNDTVNFSADSVYLWMIRMESFNADLALAYQYAASGDSISSSNVLNNLSARFDMTIQRQQEAAGMQLITDILNVHASDSLTGPDLDSLAVLANSEGGFSAETARSILKGYGQIFSLACTLPVCNCGEKSASFRKNKEDNNGILVYPNPAVDYIVFDCTTIEGRFDIQLSIRNALGRIILIHDYPDSESKFVINTTNLPAGYYFWNIHDSMMPVGFGAFIINK